MKKPNRKHVYCSICFCSLYAHLVDAEASTMIVCPACVSKRDNEPINYDTVNSYMPPKSQPGLRREYIQEYSQLYREQGLKRGDLCLNPRNPVGYCVVLTVQKRYFTLSPLTSKGWPSKSQISWTPYNIFELPKMKPPTKKGVDLFLRCCPECAIEGYDLFQAPLKKLSVHKNNYQCQNCKEYFELERGGEWASLSFE